MADDAERSWPSKNVSVEAITPTWWSMPRALGGVGQGDGEERVGDGRELRRGDVVGGALVGQRARADDDRAGPHVVLDRARSCRRG